MLLSPHAYAADCFFRMMWVLFADLPNKVQPYGACSVSNRGRRFYYSFTLTFLLWVAAGTV